MISCADGRCTVSGPITMANATAVLAESATMFAQGPLTVDLAAVTDVDSAAVSVLLEWRRAARRANAAVTFANVPANLQSLAALYGVDEFISGAA